MIAATVDLAEIAARFGERLHAAGVAVTPAMSGRFAAALAAATPQRVDELFWLARVTLVVDRNDLAMFRRVFDEVFGTLLDVEDVERNPDAPRPPPRRDELADDAEPGTHDGDDRPHVIAAASAEERLRTKPFDQCSEDELDRLRRLMDALVVTPPRRRSRRSRRSSSGSTIDLRATLRAARRTGGDPVRTPRRRRRMRPRKVVLLADVSGSMEPYGRAYLYLLHGAVRAVRAEAFVFATSLHRLTRQLATAQPAIALRAAMAAAPDWSGGTRLGAALKQFNDGWARRGVGRGAVVVIVSDGWESGDPALLAQEMERLARLAHRVVWVNPRKQSVRYEPLAGGMAAALPYVDTFVSGHSFDAFGEVLAAIAGPPS